MPMVNMLVDTFVSWWGSTNWNKKFAPWGSPWETFSRLLLEKRYGLSTRINLPQVHLVSQWWLLKWEGLMGPIQSADTNLQSPMWLGIYLFAGSPSLLKSAEQVLFRKKNPISSIPHWRGAAFQWLLWFFRIISHYVHPSCLLVFAQNSALQECIWLWTSLWFG